MVNYWKSKVLPKIKKVFEKNNTKKTAAAEACKSFDETKDQYVKEFEEKKAELQAKVIEIYEAASAEIKTLVKEPKDALLKKYSAGVQKFLDELAKIEFPGSKAVSEACSKVGASYVSGPVYFVFEKVSTFIVVEEKKEEPKADAEASCEKEEVKEKEILIEAEEKKEETAACPAPAAEACSPETAEPTAAEPPKVEEPAPAEPAKP